MCSSSVTETNPELIVMSWWALFNEGAIVGGDVAMVAVFLQHVDLCLDLLLLLFRHVHHLDGGQLACLDMTALVGKQVNHL